MTFHARHWPPPPSNVVPLRRRRRQQPHGAGIFLAAAMGSAFFLGFVIGVWLP